MRGGSVADIRAPVQPPDSVAAAAIHQKVLDLVAARDTPRT